MNDPFPIPLARSRRRGWSLLSLPLLTISIAIAATAPKSAIILDAMKAEMDRSMTHLKQQQTPPYFLSYEISETDTYNVSSSFGMLRNSVGYRRRLLNIDLRVGDYSLDNTRQVRGSFPMFDQRFSFIEVPIEDDPEAVRGVLWYQTDQKYKRAIEQLTRVNTNTRVKVAQEDQSADFSKETPEHHTEDGVPISVNRQLWEEKVRKYTAPFQRYGNIYEADASISATRETRWFVSSEGASVQTSRTYYQLFISGFTKADDGMELPRYESYFSFTPQGLPDDATVMNAVQKIISDLKALKVAPIVDPYTGPAILSGRATGVFFHEVFGHRIEGHRQKNEDEGQTFKKMIGQQLLPDFMSVYFDPTVHHHANTDLVGSYSYDDQGVKARRVAVVENGTLKTFLMSRSPIEGFPNSNGHGRGQPGFTPVARQSNLIVVAAKTVSHDELKKMLIAEVQKSGKPYGLLFDDIQGGFTMTGRTIPNAFNVLPIMVYRVYDDGREELVRGVDLIGTPLTVFSKILAADDRISVFNGVCGAESGGVPVSASGPSILVSQIEVQKKQKSQERSPILAPPFDDR